MFLSPIATFILRLIISIIVDDMEQCDCGPSPQHCDDLDICCTAPDINHPGCKVKLGKACSPAKYKCCTSDCHVSITTALLYIYIFIYIYIYIYKYIYIYIYIY